MRLIAPLSGAIVGTRRPLFRWDGPGVAVGEVCRDRGCRHVVSTFVGADHTAHALRPLPRGPLFWRVKTAGGQWSAPWEVFVSGASGHAARSILGFHYDANADGHGEAVVRALLPAPAAPPAYDRLHVYAGGPAGIVPARQTVVENAGPPVVLGDVNGDGYGDLAAGTGIYAGGRSGIASVPTGTLPNTISLYAAGDIDGDGYGDVVGGNIFGGTKLWIYRGSASGPSVTGIDIDFATKDPFVWTAPIAAADLNGDGYGDVVLFRRNSQTNEGSLGFVRGGPGGVLDGGTTTFVPGADYPQTTATGDVNGDGIADFIFVRAPGTADVYFGSSSGLPPTASQTIALSSGSDFIRNLAIGDFNGDGIADVAASVHAASNIMFFDDERVDIHLSSAAGLNPVSAQSLRETDYFPDDHNRFGFMSASAGDFDGDGRDDLLVGASTVFPPPLPDGFPEGPSDGFVFRGSPDGVSPMPLPRLIGESGFGTNVAASSPSWQLI
ncbi:MAG TPA: VCBS repeat-containing protein [Polyangia bacterium]|nr:VCBS repeat-containing protein [Polyangia bacterium]